MGEALLVLGLAHGTRGTTGIELLAQAADTLAGSPRRVLHADALLALGATRAGAGAPHEAIGALHEAHRIAAAAGAGRVTRSVAEVLDRYRLPAVADEGRGHARLTATERTVLQLVEAGASVAEVGQKLFLTPASVERHLDAARRRG